MFNRKNKEQISIRQKMVRYAQRHGIKPAARYFGCSKNTIKEWLHRFNKHGAGGLENKSRAPHSCPHKTSQEMEDLIISKRKLAPCHGPKSLKHYNPSIKPSQSAIYRILKQRDLLRKHRKKHQRKNDLRAVKALYKVRHEAPITLADESSAEKGMPPISYQGLGYTKVTTWIKRRSEKLQAVSAS